MDEPKRLIVKPATLSDKLLEAVKKFEKSVGDLPETIEASERTIEKIHRELPGFSERGGMQVLKVLGVQVREAHDVPDGYFRLAALYSHA